MFRLLALIALAGCGRIGFDVASQPAASDGAPGDIVPGHDEDGDGLPDSIDPCPFLAGDNADGDGDGVGDACDPNVATPGDRIALFLTMQPDDQPTVAVDFGAGVWTQEADALRVDGDLNGDFYAGRTLPISLTNVRLDIGFDILAVGSATTQHQFAASTTTVLPNYFGELNEYVGQFSNAQLSYYDGVTFSQAQASGLPNGIHPGSVHYVLDERSNTSVTLSIDWPGEPHMLMISDNVYQTSDQLQFNVNNLQLEIRYVCMITWP